MRRAVYIVIAIIVIVVGVIVFFALRNNATTNVAPPGGSTGTLPSTGTQTGTGNGAGAGNTSSSSLPATGVTEGNSSTSFGLVSNETVFSYFVDKNNDVEMVEPNGAISEVANGQGGQATFLSSSAIQNIVSAGFSYDGAKAFVNFGDPSNPQTSVFNITTKAWTPLPAGIISPVWSPADYRIAYLSANANGSVTLNTLDLSKATNKSVALVTLGAQDLTLSWPTKNIIAIADRPSSYSEGNLWFYNLATKVLTPAATPAYGLTAIWSATTNPVAAVWGGVASGRGGALSLLGALGTSTRVTAESMNVLTLPSKCVFNSQTSASSSVAYLALYCAVPQNTNTLSSAVLPDAYNQMALFTADNFYRIHTDTGVVDTVLLPNGSYDGSQLHVFNNILFFVNRYDEKLYAISLAN